MKLRSIFHKKSASEKNLSAYLKKTFNFTPNSFDLYFVAFTHSSVLAHSKEYIESNERLEFLGDSILDLVVAKYLYEVFPKNSEGDLTKMKAKVVSRRNLNVLAQELNIESQLNYSINSSSSSTSILGNALEALIGAIYLDLGYRKSEKVVLKILEDSNLEEVLFEQKDFKSLIHEWCQQHKKQVHFITEKEFIVDGRMQYEVAVKLDGKSLGSATASSKKKAQQKAAKVAYEVLNQ